MNPINPGRLGFIMLVLGVIAFLRWWFIYEQPLQGIDDANIYFVYAKNLAEGHGFVYNPGGERVEGFTSMLWAVILGIYYMLGPMEALALLTNFILISYSLYRLSLLADKLSTSSSSGFMSLPAWLILLFVGLVPGYLDWTLFTHMETGIWSCLLILCSVLLLEQFIGAEGRKYKLAFTFLLPLLIFTRPESLAWGGLFLLIQFFQQYQLKLSFASAIRGTLAPVASFAGSLLLLFIFRLNYFGYPFPNTFYAKVSSGLGQNIIDGAYYLLRYSKENPFIPVFLLLLGVSFLFLLRSIHRRQFSPVSAVQLCIIAICGLNFLLPFYTGGDHFYLSRFYQPLYPILLLGVFNFSFWKEQSTLHLYARTPQQALLILAALSLLILGTSGLALFKDSPIRKEFDIATYGRETGIRLNQLFAGSKEAPSVGTYLAGGLAYTYNGETIDLLGLNNTLMAHAPKNREGGYKNHDGFNKLAFYKLSPDILHIDFIESPKDAALYEHDSTDFQNQVYKYIFLEDRFRSLYAPVVIAGPNEEHWYQAYVHENYLEQLRKEKRKFYLISRKKSMHNASDDITIRLSLKER
jgi:arabinofuranosyltransferase